MKILFGETELARGNEYGEVPLELKISGNREVQILSTIRGRASKALDRGNLVTSVEFRIRRKHATVEDAQKDTINYASSIDTSPSTLTIISEPGNTTYLLDNAVISGVVSSSSGNISEHFYKIIGGAISEEQ